MFMDRAFNKASWSGYDGASWVLMTTARIQLISSRVQRQDNYTQKTHIVHIEVETTTQLFQALLQTTDLRWEITGTAHLSNFHDCLFNPQCLFISIIRIEEYETRTNQQQLIVSKYLGAELISSTRYSGRPKWHILQLSQKIFRDQRESLVITTWHSSGEILGVAFGSHYIIEQTQPLKTSVRLTQATYDWKLNQEKVICII